MKKILFVLLAMFASQGVVSDTVVERAEKDQVTFIPDDDPAMAEAMRRARSSLDQFLEIYKNRSADQSSFAVKVGISEDERTEFFWISDFYEEGEGAFKGIINNQPRMVHRVRIGQLYAFKKSEIVDWVYTEQGKMKGNYTACALLSHEPKEQQEQFKKQYGLNCDGK
jgi:uncharacterized protein YegJ (DUF2314 family)